MPSPLPAVSVVMCVQNGMPFLPLAVESIRNQTRDDWEFLIVDDRSSDDTWTYLESLNDPRIRLLRNAGQGQTAGLNQALRLARAPWIARMDADDWSFPERLERQLEAAQSDPSAVLLSADYVLCEEDLSPVSTVRLKGDLPALLDYMRARNNPLCHPVMTFRADAALAVGGYDETLKNAQDYRLWMELLKKGGLRHVPVPLLKYRVRRGSLSILRQPEQSRERRAVLSGGAPGAGENLPASFRKEREIEGLYHYRLAFAAWSMGDRRRCRLHAARAFRLGTRRRQCLAMLLTFWLPRALYLRLGGYHRLYA